MEKFGTDFQKYTSPFLYAPSNPAGLWAALGIALLLIVANGIFQAVAGTTILSIFFDGGLGDPKSVVKAFIIGVLPASLLTAILAWQLAKIRGGRPQEVLALRWPDLGWLGWLCIIGGFMLVVYGAILVLVTVFQIDLADYTPGPDGQSPTSGSSGLVKEAMFDMANEPLLFWLAFPAVALGAPLAEELIFRGQLFSALARSRTGYSGATLITSALWSMLHLTEPWLAVGLIFMMGLALGALLIRFGSLWVTIACHGIWNGAYSLIIIGTLPQ
jgi:membrane protease YdiL (CAAX protease family)